MSGHHQQEGLKLSRTVRRVAPDGEQTSGSIEVDCLMTK
jgi:hypothetical protein